MCGMMATVKLFAHVRVDMHANFTAKNAVSFFPKTLVVNSKVTVDGVINDIARQTKKEGN
jgi:hypothetical protein